MCNTKHCPKCGQTKPTTEFHKDRTKRDGVQTQCKECKKATAKAWHGANKDRRAATNKVWNEANKEKAAASKKAWQEAHREYMQAYKAKQRAIKAGIDSDHFTEEQWKEKLQQHRHTCYYCGKQDDKLQVDHVVPLTDPHSSNAIYNVVPCCQSCNCRKKDRSAEVFNAELEAGK